MNDKNIESMGVLNAYCLGGTIKTKGAFYMKRILKYFELLLKLFKAMNMILLSSL